MSSDNLNPSLVPGMEKYYSYEIDLNNSSGSLGSLVLLGWDKVIGSVALSDDGKLHYLGSSTSIHPLTTLLFQQAQLCQIFHYWQKLILVLLAVIR